MKPTYSQLVSTLHAAQIHLAWAGLKGPTIAECRELAKSVHAEVTATLQAAREPEANPPDSTAKLPRVIVTIWRGLPSVYADIPGVSVEVVDTDTDDLKERKAADKRIAEIEAEEKAGTLRELA